MTKIVGTSEAPAAVSAWSGRARPDRLWRHRLATAGVVAVLVSAASFVLRFNPTDRVADPTGPCLWHAMTGINGPACGGTRMFYYLLHGNIVQAARHHLVALIAVPFVLYAFAEWAGRVWFGFSLPRLQPSRRVYVAYGVGVAAVHGRPAQPVLVAVQLVRHTEPRPVTTGHPGTGAAEAATNAAAGILPARRMRREE